MDMFRACVQHQHHDWPRSAPFANHPQWSSLHRKYLSGAFLNIYLFIQPNSLLRRTMLSLQRRPLPLTKLRLKKTRLKLSFLALISSVSESKNWRIKITLSSKGMCHHLKLSRGISPGSTIWRNRSLKLWTSIWENSNLRMFGWSGKSRSRVRRFLMSPSSQTIQFQTWRLPTKRSLTILRRRLFKETYRI